MYKNNTTPNVAETYKIINKPVYKSAKYKGRAQLEAIKALLEKVNDK